MKKINIEGLLQLISDHEAFSSENDDLLTQVINDVLNRYPSAANFDRELDEDELDQVFAAGKPMHTSSRKPK